MLSTVVEENNEIMDGAISMNEESSKEIVDQIETFKEVILTIMQSVALYMLM